MIDKNGWFDWAIRDPGPLDRWRALGSKRTPVSCAVAHSMEGWFHPLSSDGYNVMEDNSRFPTAWHGTVTQKEPKFYQHFPVDYYLQHGNSANAVGPGFETEGLYNQPLNTGQCEIWKRIILDLEAYTGREFKRSTDKRTGLVEHREVAGAQTACPSERYAPLWLALTMEADEVTREEHDAILARIAQLEVQAWGESGVPRTNEKGYAPMNMYELATGRTYQAHAQGAPGPRKVTLVGTLTEE